jgi:hypothetical protein
MGQMLHGARIVRVGRGRCPALLALTAGVLCAALMLLLASSAAVLSIRTGQGAEIIRTTCPTLSPSCKSQIVPKPSSPPVKPGLG